MVKIRVEKEGCIRLPEGYKGRYVLGDVQDQSSDRQASG